MSDTESDVEDIPHDEGVKEKTKQLLPATPKKADSPGTDISISGDSIFYELSNIE